MAEQPLSNLMGKAGQYGSGPREREQGQVGDQYPREPGPDPNSRDRRGSGRLGVDVDEGDYNRWLVGIDKSGPEFRRGYGARLAAAKPAVPVAGYEAVDPVADGARHDPRSGKKSVGEPESSGDAEGGVGFGVYPAVIQEQDAVR